MSKEYIKYIARLPKKLRNKLNDIINLIIVLELKDLDCKKLKGFENIFRIRAGNIRIVFEKRKNTGVILEINTRGDIY